MSEEKRLASDDSETLKEIRRKQAKEALKMKKQTEKVKEKAKRENERENFFNEIKKNTLEKANLAYEKARQAGSFIKKNILQNKKVIASIVALGIISISPHIINEQNRADKQRNDAVYSDAVSSAYNQIEDDKEKDDEKPIEDEYKTDNGANNNKANSGSNKGKNDAISQTHENSKEQISESTSTETVTNVGATKGESEEEKINEENKKINAAISNGGQVVHHNTTAPNKNNETINYNIDTVTKNNTTQNNASKDNNTEKKGKPAISQDEMQSATKAQQTNTVTPKKDTKTNESKQAKEFTDKDFEELFNEGQTR